MNSFTLAALILANGPIPWQPAKLLTEAAACWWHQRRIRQPKARQNGYNAMQGIGMSRQPANAPNALKQPENGGNGPSGQQRTKTPNQ